MLFIFLSHFGFHHPRHDKNVLPAPLFITFCHRICISSNLFWFSIEHSSSDHQMAASFVFGKVTNVTWQVDCEIMIDCITTPFHFPQGFWWNPMRRNFWKHAENLHKLWQNCRDWMKCDHADWEVDVYLIYSWMVIESAWFKIVSFACIWMPFYHI